jgi:hypothetical protein
LVRGLIAGLLVVLIVAVGLVVMSGALDPRPDFSVQLPGSESHSSIGVELRDATGLVTAMEPGTPPGPEVFDIRAGGTVENAPDRASVLIVRWLGGACEDRAELVLAPASDGYTLSLTTVGRLVLGCNAAGIVRTVNLILARDVDASSVSIVHP